MAPDDARNESAQGRPQGGLDGPHGLVAAHAPVLVVLGAYVVAAFVIPTLSPVAVVDDWVYAQAVERLVEDGVLRIPDLAVANLLFQVAWGALFAELFGLSFGALRASTVVLTFVSGVAFYGLCRELGVRRRRSALGTAAYLFNPLGFVLGYTFMTDAFFTALLVVSAFWFVRGVRLGDDGLRSTVVGSLFASLAFLVRQQGALIPVAVVTFLLLARRLSFDRSGVKRLAAVVTVPAVVMGLFYVWLAAVNGVPESQGAFLEEVREAGVDGTSLLVGRLGFVQLMYAGLFAVPVTALVASRLVRIARTAPRGALVATAAVSAAVVLGVVTFWHDRRMPYVPQFLSPNGVGSYDMAARPPPVVGQGFLDAVTVLSAVSVVLLALVVARRMASRNAAMRAGAGLALALVAWQAVGAMLPSFHFREWQVAVLGPPASAPSVDRYLAPLIPFAICLGLWALREVRLRLWAGWAAVAILGAVAVAGTRDFLVFQREAWDVARDANAAGVPNTKLDAGAAWSGYHLYEYSVRTKSPMRSPGGPWYLHAWAPATDSTYVVSPVPLPGYEVRWARRYSSWLPRDGTVMYLLRRAGQDGPV